MRFLRQLKLLLTQNDDGTGRVDFDDQDALARTETDEAFIDKVSTGTLQLAASASMAVPFGGVTTASVLLIESDQELDLTFNGGAETLKLKAPAAPSSGSSPTQRGVLYWEGEFTSVSITVDAGATADANVLYAVVGV